MELEQFSRLLGECFESNGLRQYITQEICQQFYHLTLMLCETNAQTNLTAIRRPEDMISLHYADSLLAAQLLPLGVSVLDCGCGAGFPCLPLAIVRPDLHITALDSTAKKLDFVRNVAATLGLAHLNILCGRAEDLAHTAALREHFDVCTARAVAALPVLSELCLPFVKIGGVFLSLKGAKARLELEQTLPALPTLGAKLEQMVETSLCVSGTNDSNLPAHEARGLILICKTAATPSGYPRKYAQILKKPLGSK